MKKFLCLLLSILLAISLVGCKASAEASAKKAVEKGIEALAKSNFIGVSKYFETDSDLSLSDLKELLANKENLKVISKYLSTLKCEVISTTVKSDNLVVVRTDITCIDFKKVGTEVFSGLLTWAFSSALSSGEPTEEQTMQKMIELLSQSYDMYKNEEMSITVDLNVIKDGKNWVIAKDNVSSLASALLGDFLGSFID